MSRIWYESRSDDVQYEKKRIVKMAANIILEDIRSEVYDKTNYRLLNAEEETKCEDVPATLLEFLNIVIKKHKHESPQSAKKWNKRVATMAHCLITSARPRSFLSPILLGLSAMLHKKHGSRDTIDSLAYLGLCSSYEETLLFEASITKNPENNTCSEGTHIQYVFDNADHNTCTIDGKNTFHSMGGIAIATPASGVMTKQEIPRLNKIPISVEIGSHSFTELKIFEKQHSTGLKSIIIEDVFGDDEEKCFDISMPDFIWQYSKFSNAHSLGWNSFMEKMYKNSNYQTSKIIPLPFVNNPPSDYNTIFTVLSKAAADNKLKHNQKRCFVTFDQPLYFKAREILASVESNELNELSAITVRLGGFHTLMSFLGAIGFIMDGSGLKKALCEIYAEKSVEKMLTGHDYSRAIRGHFLMYQALSNIAFESLQLSEMEKGLLNELLEDLGEEHFIDDIEKEEYIEINNKYMEHLQKIKNRGPTAELLIQYMEMVQLVKDFIRAERSGNFSLHLKCIKKMLPYFHASGHFLYAKSAQLYLQDMLKLETMMSDIEYQRFVTDGFFTVRRTSKFWSGIWSDMTIEQVLMRSMHSQGGLTHGRGFSDSVLTKFIATMIVLIDVCNEVEEFCNSSFNTSEQHVDARESRIARDNSDVKKLSAFLEKHNPFPESIHVMSFFSTIVGGSSINCHKAYEVGMRAAKSIIGNTFGSIKFQRKTKVLSLKTVNSSIKVNGEKITINPLLLFQRISLQIKNIDDMRDNLKYELAPFPLALFTDNGFKKNSKSDFYKCFIHTNELPNSNKTIVNVIDGGFLLHKVIWQKNDSVEVIKKNIPHM